VCRGLCENGGTLKAEDYNFFLWERERKLSNGKRIFVQHRILSAVKRVEFVSDKVLYIVLTGRWLNIIVLNESAPSDENGDDPEDCFKRT
jgi:hypothetical protein